MGSSVSMVRSSQHSARRSACEGGKAGSRSIKMALVCSTLEMSKAGSGSSSPNSLGVGTRSGSVLAVSMTFLHRSSHRLSEVVVALMSASDGGGSKSPVSSKGGWGG